MQTIQIPGVPLAMQRDGWWLDAPIEPSKRREILRKWGKSKAALLLALICLGDVLVWDVMPGVNIALFAGIVLFAGLAVAWPRIQSRKRIAIICGILLSLLPLVELLQPLSILVGLTGLSLCCAAIGGLSRADVLRGAARLWWIAPMQVMQDSVQSVEHVKTLSPGALDLRGLVLGWAVPAGTTLVFALLILAANPVLDRWLIDATSWEMNTPDLSRVYFWLFLAAAIWPALVLPRMRERLRARRPARITVQRQGAINAASVTRSLVAFNALFALQTGTDILFLYGDASLPEGISPATYAHRGAYPLLATALLAGLFAVMARPFLAGRPILRALMLIWLIQTLALVVASVWRLDIYVDAFGLTRLRLAAYIWMGLVAAGLVLVLWQIWRDKCTAWMMLRSGALGAMALYVCAFVSFDGLVARHNLDKNDNPDVALLCRSSEDVIPALVAKYGPDWRSLCQWEFDQPVLFHPTDWREWGFRNWRTRNSVAALLHETAVP
ncbi:MAG: DUF4173 domain-containing protein [Tateyamaria sp.]